MRQTLIRVAPHTTDPNQPLAFFKFSPSQIAATLIAEWLLFYLLVVMHDRAVVVGGILVQSIDFVKVMLQS